MWKYIGMNHTDITTENTPHFAILPHHGITEKKLTEFYTSLHEKYPEVRRVLIISPNHFNAGGGFALSEPTNGTICFLDSCIPGEKIVGLEPKDSDFPLFRSKTGSNIFTTREHGIGIHISYLRKFFPSDTVLIPLVISRERDSFPRTDTLYNTLISSKTLSFDSSLLVLASVDFSHHTDEAFARFHDAKTVSVLTDGGDFSGTEVDCQNCLKLVTDLAHHFWQTRFELFGRTSVDTVMQTDSKTGNTSHIFGVFSSPEKECTFHQNWFFDFLSERARTVLGLPTPCTPVYVPQQVEKKNEEPIHTEYTINTLEGFSPSKDDTRQVYGAFFWDTSFARGIEKNARENTHYFSGVLQEFFQGNDPTKTDMGSYHTRLYGFDFVWANLETAIGDHSCTGYIDKPVRLISSPEYLRILRTIGITMVNTANNHSEDCGMGSYATGIDSIKRAGLEPFGNDTVLKKEVRGIKVAFIGVNDFNPHIDYSHISEQIRSLRQDGYRVIVNAHFGDEYENHHNKRQETIAHGLVDAGASIIIGHHPHVIQDIEYYHEIPIVYSLGNFLFDQSDPSTLSGAVALFAIGEKKTTLELVPFHRDPTNYSIHF